MSKSKADSFVFGPVPSRRLGRSLGIDLVPYKVCSYDCLYCQVGFTTDKTSVQKSFADVDDIIEDLKAKLDTAPDYITLSGSGEPSLYRDFAQLLKRIKQITDVPVAVITNGSLLSRSEVRAGLDFADLVIPSLDAADEKTFKKINRPCSEIGFDKMVQGLIDFSRQYKGKIWLEVFLIAGINDSDEHIAALAEIIRKINPDKVQLNTVVRPAAESSVKAVSPKRMQQIADKIHKNAEVIADYSKMPEACKSSVRQEDILQMLKRRPCTAKDVADGLAIPINETAKYIQILLDADKISAYKQGSAKYYKAN